MTLPAAFLDRPIAHRAYHDVTAGRPENSRAAVAAAIEAGYGIEIDIQPSADGVPLVFHDYDMARLTGSAGAIGRRTAAELAMVPLLHGGEGVPTLAQVLADVAGRVPILVEVKDQDGAMGPNVGPLEQAVADLLNPYQGPLAVMSFNPHSVAAMAEVAPDIPRGIVTSSYEPEKWPTLPAAVCDRLRPIPDFDRVGACFVSHEATDLASPYLAALKARDVQTLCWTIRSAEAEAEARRAVDNVTFEGYPA